MTKVLPYLIAALVSFDAPRPIWGHLKIDQLGIDVDIVIAVKTKYSWDFSYISSTAGYLEGTALPDEHGNTVIGGHVDRIFGKLSTIHEGATITLTFEGKEYIYRVGRKHTISFDNLSPVAPRIDALTLLTCDGYYEGAYRQRLVVEAHLVEVRESHVKMSSALDHMRKVKIDK